MGVRGPRETGVRRRPALAGLLAAGVSGGLSALAPAVSATAAPRRAVAGDVVTFTPFCDCWGIPVDVGNALVEQALQPFYRAHPSVRVQFVPPGGDSWLPQALLGGTAPDVFVNSN